ncbi:MAG: C2H2-type zinc finger protein [Sedimenticola sp.]
MKKNSICVPTDMADTGSQDEDWWAQLLDHDVDPSALKQETDRLATELGCCDVYKCPKCTKNFSNKSNLKKHVVRGGCSKREGKKCEVDNLFECPKCSKKFSNKSNLKKHVVRGVCSKREGKKCEVDNSLECPKCSKKISNKSNLKKHVVRDVCSKRDKDKPCHKCNKSFSTEYNLNRHLRRKACGIGSNVYQCRVCDKQFSHGKALRLHVLRKHSSASTNKQPPCAAPVNRPDNGNGHGDSSGSDGVATDAEHDADDVTYRRMLFDGDLVRYRLVAVQEEIHDLLNFFSSRRDEIHSNIVRELRRLRSVKWYVAVKIHLVKLDGAGDVVDEARPFFRSSAAPVLHSTLIGEQIDAAYFKMANSLDSFRAEGSSWIVRDIEFMEQTILKYNPLRGSCSDYRIPEILQRKRCILNVTGTDDVDGQCFEFAVLAGLYSRDVGSKQCTEFYQYRNTLTFEGIKDGARHMPVTEIAHFEETNSISINVFGYENGETFPIHVTSRHTPSRHVNLLLLPAQLSDDDDADDDADIDVDNHQDVTDNNNDENNIWTVADNRRSHYCVIQHMTGLLSSQLTAVRRKKYFCMHCLSYKYSEWDLAEHERLCYANGQPLATVMPEQHERILKFKNYGRRMRVSFVIVANFVCYTTRLYDTGEPVSGFVVRERRLDPCAYSYMRISVDDSHPSPPVFYRGTDAADTMRHFLNAMADEEKKVFDIVSHAVPPVLCEDGVENLAASADVCFVCREPFLPNERIAEDHSHVSGAFLIKFPFSNFAVHGPENVA